jgi:two-component system NarL family response regulator
VLLVDDHRLVREALRDMLSREADIDVVGEAGDAASAFKAVDDLKPDVVVLDVGLPDINGIEVAARLKDRDGFGARIVALSVHAERHVVTEMLRAGASAYVTKSSASAEIVQAIRSVAQGEGYLCPEVADSLVLAVRNASERSDTSLLSPREREVLRMVVSGTRSPSIADQLNIAVGTVEVHRRNIMRKTGARTVADLTRYAIREGFLPS